MALPTISHNTPAAGSISWTGFGIQYNGQSFSIPAGNTAHKFVWWLYGGGTAPALQSGNELPALSADDMILFINKGGVGALVPTSELLDGSLIVGGSVIAQAIATDAIQSQHISADAVTADAIAAGAVMAEHLSAGSITTEKLSVGSVSDNLVTNGSFEEYDTNGLPLGWRVIQQSNGGTADIVTGVSSSGANALRLVATGTTSNIRVEQTPEKFIPVSSASSRRWYVAVRAGAGTATSTGNWVRVNWYDANKVFVSYTDVRANGGLTTTFTIYEGQVTPPATARYMGIALFLFQPNVATNAYFDEVIAREVTMATQIGDGQITAAKVASKAITADKLVVSDSSNYVNDWRFDYWGVGWNGINSASGGTIATITDPPVAGTGTRALQMTGTSAVKDVPYDPIPVAPGDWYYATCYVRATVTTTSTGTIQLGATVNRTTGGATWPSFQNIAANSLSTANAWVQLAGAIEIPADATTLQLRPSVRNDVTGGTFQFRDFVLRRMNGGELIVDGEIVANHLAANSVTSDKIEANAVTATKILAGAIGTNHMVANSIHADRLIANSITADKLDANAINGKTITGATIQTGEVNTGFRMVLDETGLNGWDANNINFLKADEEGLEISGTLQAIGDGVDYDVFEYGQYGSRPVEISVGAAVGRRPGIMTEQWPPPVPSQAIPGIGFQPQGVDMYHRAGLTAPDGQYVTLQSGVTMEQYNAWASETDSNGMLVNAGKQLTASTLNLHKDGASFSKYVSAEEFRVGGLEMGAAEVEVFDTSGTMPNNQIPVAKIGTLVVNNTFTTNDMLAWNIPGPGKLKIANAGVYDITFSYGQQGGATANRNFIEIGIEGGPNDRLVARSAFAAGEDSVSVTATGVKLNKDEILKFEVLQNSGAARTYQARVRLTKVAAPVPTKAWENGNQTLTGNLTVDGNLTVKHRRAEFNCGYFDVAANAVWDIGPQTLSTSAPGTLNNDFCKQGPYAGSVEFTKSGYYAMTAFVAPNGNPGGTWLRAQRSGDGRFLGQTSNGAAWENTLTLVPFYFAAGEYVRFAYSASIAHSIKSWVTITQAY